LSLAICSLIVAGVQPVLADDWSQWRGPGRDGQLATAVVPESWPESLEEAWKVEVGEGHSSPVVVGETVYTFARRDGEETVTALSLADGRVLWRSSYPAPYSLNPAAAGHGAGPKSTPVFAGGRLITLGISGILSAWDARSGELLWREEFGDRFGRTLPLYGSAMSPLVDGERLIAHVGGAGMGALTAFDLASGKEIWSWAGEGPGYASPVVATYGGVRQVVTQAEESIVGIAAESGKLLWRIPFTTPWVQNCVTPVVAGDLLVYSGLQQGTVAGRPRVEGGSWKIEEVWRSDEASFYMSTPVLVGTRLCGFSHLRSGQYLCLDSRSGETIWAGQGRGGENAAVLVAGNWIIGLSDGAELLVIDAAADEYTPVARYDVASSPTWAHPVVLPGRVLVKDKEHLTLLRFP
jgi:outer membrane protein assembly factor BamB